MGRWSCVRYSFQMVQAGREGTLSRPEGESLERSLPLSRLLRVALALAQDTQEFIPHE